MGYNLIHIITINQKSSVVSPSHLKELTTIQLRINSMGEKFKVGEINIESSLKAFNKNMSYNWG